MTRVDVIDFLSSYLAEMDLRIEIFVLKLVNAEKFMMFGQSGRELWRFENLVFPNLYI
jgi:hypothetical protein